MLVKLNLTINAQYYSFVACDFVVNFSNNAPADAKYNASVAIVCKTLNLHPSLNLFK